MDTEVQHDRSRGISPSCFSPPFLWIIYNHMVIFFFFLLFAICIFDSLDAQMLQAAPLDNQHLVLVGVLSTEPGSSLGCSDHAAPSPVPIRAGAWSSDTCWANTNAFCMLVEKGKIQVDVKSGNKVTLKTRLV